MIKKEEIKSMAAIAKISITEIEAEKFADDLNDMFAFINMIDEKDFNSNEFSGFPGSESFFRHDEIIKPPKDSGNISISESIDISLL